MLVTDINTVKKYVPNTTLDKIDVLSSFIEIAEQNEVIPVIGRDLFNAVSSGSGSGEGEDYAQLRSYVERPIVLFAFAKAVPILDVKITENGFAVTSDMNLAPASKERVANFREAVEESAYDGIESLLVFLYENKDRYPEFSVPASKSFLINSAAEIDEYFNISRSRRLYLKLAPLISRVERFKIIPEISLSLYADIILKNIDDANLGVAYSAIIPDLKAASVYLAISEAIMVLSSDIKFNKIVRNYTIGKSSYGSDQILAELKKSFYDMGIQHLMSAKAYIIDNADSFPLFKESDLYSEDETEADQAYENTEESNTFTFGYGR